MAGRGASAEREVLSIDDDSPLGSARRSGRLPALRPRPEGARKRKRDEIADKWRDIVGGTGGTRREVPNPFEPSVYDRDGREE